MLFCGGVREKLILSECTDYWEHFLIPHTNISFVCRYCLLTHCGDEDLVMRSLHVF